MAGLHVPGGEAGRQAGRQASKQAARQERDHACRQARMPAVIQ
jgi:hypothetical protein